MAPCFAGSKRPLEMVLYDPAAAASKRARHVEDEADDTAGALVPHHVAPTAPPPLDVEPINAVPHRLPTRPRPPPAARKEPECLRKHFLLALGLRGDLPVHFIDEKLVTSTDLDAHQNRFRIPSDGVLRRLRAILTPAELHSANLLHDPPPNQRPKPNKKPSGQENGAAAGDDEGQQGKKIKKPKKRGKEHGGLRVKLVDLAAGDKELMMSRWDSSKGTIVKGEGYLDFIRRCGLQRKDAVEIWAFVQRPFQLFGENVSDESLLHLLIVKKHQGEHCHCHYCPPPAPADHSSSSVDRESVMA